MDKKTFLMKQIAKTNKKNYENYVITRIIHGVNEPDAKFITQQYISRGDGRYALRDLYLPQIKYHVEVDEAQHEDDAAIVSDDLREQDIVNSIALLPVKRIKATVPLEAFNQAIDATIQEIRCLINAGRESKTFVSWDPEKECCPETYIEQKFMDAKDDVAFYRHADACNCFGHNYTQWYSALAKHPHEPDWRIWFPKLYENAEWDNSISADEKTIYERKKQDNEEFICRYLECHAEFKRLIFARVRGPLGDVMYRFKGLYEVDIETSRRDSTITYRRIKTRVDTYPPEQKSVRTEEQDETSA